MSGFLDSYGVDDQRRENRTKKIVLWGLGVLIVGTVLYFTFHTWRQERVIKSFLAALEQKDYHGAYLIWGCTPEDPCKYYPPEKFIEDFGPTGEFAKIVNAKIENVDSCGEGVVFRFSMRIGDGGALWVQRDTNAISFAPWPRCPGRHLHLWEFLKSRFS